MNTPLRTDTSKCGDQNHGCYKCISGLEGISAGGVLTLGRIKRQTDKDAENLARAENFNQWDTNAEAYALVAQIQMDLDKLKRLLKP